MSSWRVRTVEVLRDSCQELESRPACERNQTPLSAFLSQALRAIAEVAALGRQACLDCLENRVREGGGAAVWGGGLGHSRAARGKSGGGVRQN